MREQVDPLKARLTTSAPAKVYFYLKYMWNTPVHNNHPKKMSIRTNIFTFGVVRSDN